MTATIDGFSNPYYVAVTPNGEYAYVTNTYPIGYSVSVINTATNTVTATITLSAPTSVAITPNGKYAYIASGQDDLGDKHND